MAEAYLDIVFTLLRKLTYATSIQNAVSASPVDDTLSE